MVTTEQLLLLAETSAAIGATEDLEQALRTLLGGMARLTGADSGGVRLFTDSDILDAPHRLFFWDSGDTFVWREMNLPLGANTRRVVLEGEAVYTPDLLPLMEAGDAVAALSVQVDALRSSLIVPLRAGGRVIGTLHADARRPNAFDAALLVPLQLLADHAAGAVERTRLADTAHRQLQQLRTAMLVSATVNEEGDLDTLLRRLIEETVAAVHAQLGMVALVDPARREIRGRVGANLPPGLIEATVRPLFTAAHPDEDIFALVARTGEQLLVPADHPARHRQTMERFALQQDHGVLTPIRHAGQTIGAFSVFWNVASHIDPQDLAILRLVANQAGAVIAHALLGEAERRARQGLDAALLASAAVVFAYDATGRLTYVAGNVTAVFGWSAEELLGMQTPDLIAPTERSASSARFLKRLAGKIADGPYETVLLNRSGEKVPVLISGRSQVVDGALVGGAGALIDLRPMQRLRQERDAALAARARAEAAIRTGRAVAHELASPIGAALEPILKPGGYDR